MYTGLPAAAGSLEVASAFVNPPSARAIATMIPINRVMVLFILVSLSPPVSPATVLDEYMRHDVEIKTASYARQLIEYLANDCDEAVLTHSFASPAFAGSAFSCFLLNLLGQVRLAHTTCR